MARGRRDDLSLHPRDHHHRAVTIIVSGLIEPIALLLYGFDYLHALWTDASDHPRKTVRVRARKDLEEAVVAVVMLGSALLAIGGIVISWVLDPNREGMEAVLFVAPAIILAGHGLSWYIVEWVGGYLGSKAHRPGNTENVLVFILHGALGWAMIAAFVIWLSHET